MTSEQITIHSWNTASPSQAWAVRLRARCWTLQQIADTVECDYRTVVRWAGMGEFQEAVRAEMDAIWEPFDEQMTRIIRKAAMIVEMSEDGDVDADSPRVQLAHDTLTKTAYAAARRRPPRVGDDATVPEPPRIAGSSGAMGAGESTDPAA